jgi:hypothetical protein
VHIPIGLFRLANQSLTGRRHPFVRCIRLLGCDQFRQHLARFPVSNSPLSWGAPTLPITTLAEYSLPTQPRWEDECSRTALGDPVACGLSTIHQTHFTFMGGISLNPPVAGPNQCDVWRARKIFAVQPIAKPKLSEYFSNSLFGRGVSARDEPHYSRSKLTRRLRLPLRFLRALFQRRPFLPTD